MSGIRNLNLEIRKMEKIDLHITIDKTTANHLLGGLAKQYRSIPTTAPSSVNTNIRITINEILSQLESQGVDILKPRSPFKPYVQLVNYDKPF